PDSPGEVFGDSAYQGSHFAMRPAPRAAHHASSPSACGVATKQKRSDGSMPRTGRSIGFVAVSRRSSAHGSAVTACAECDGEDLLDTATNPMDRPVLGIEPSERFC